MSREIYSASAPSSWVAARVMVSRAEAEKSRLHLRARPSPLFACAACFNSRQEHGGRARCANVAMGLDSKLASTVTEFSAKTYALRAQCMLRLRPILLAYAKCSTGLCA